MPKQPRDRQWQAQLVAALYQNNQHGWVGLIVLWVGFSFAYGLVWNMAYVTLSCLLLLGVCGHFLNQRSFWRNQARGIDDVARWRWSAASISGYSGLVIGLSPCFLLDLQDLSKVYLVTALVVLPIFGSSVISGTVRLVHMFWTLTLTLPLILMLLLSEQRELIIMGTMLLVSGIPSAALMNLYFYRLYLKSIRLGDENRDLLEEVREQKRRAEYESREKSRFLAATSHDLRQPLHALDLFLGALRLKVREPESRELLDKARLSSRALGDLLGALMDISRLDSGAIQLRLCHVELADHIEAVSEEFCEQAERRGITLHKELQPVLVKSDPLLLSRLMRNLVSNAIKHNHDCELYVQMRVRDDSVTVLFRDTGKGIESHELDKIFSEFYQLNNPERDRNKGLGLGLAIVKKLVALLDIDLSVRSAPGDGCEFALTMPISEGVVSPRDPPQPEISYDLSGLFVTVVDDEYMVRDGLKALLRSWDCEVLMADSGDRLLRDLIEEGYAQPDIILSDYRLPDNETGVEVVEKVRAHFDSPIPAIIITGDSSAGIEEARRCHCAVMVKPVQSEALAVMIESLR